MSREILNQAIGLAKESKGGEGIELLRPLLSDPTLKVYAVFALGFCHERMGNLETARYLYGEAIKGNPNQADWPKHLARCETAYNQQLAEGMIIGEDFEDSCHRACEMCGLHYLNSELTCPYCQASNPTASLIDPDVIQIEGGKPDLAARARMAAKGALGKALSKAKDMGDSEKVHAAKEKTMKAAGNAAEGMKKIAQETRQKVRELGDSEKVQSAKTKAKQLAGETAQGFDAAKRSAKLLLAIREIEKKKRALQQQLEEAFKALGTKAEQIGAGAGLPAWADVLTAREKISHAESSLGDMENQIASIRSRMTDEERTHSAIITSLENDYKPLSERQKTALAELKSSENQITTTKAGIKKLESQTEQAGQGKPTSEPPDAIKAKIAQLEQSLTGMEASLESTRAREAEARRLAEAKSSEVQSARNQWKQIKSNLDAELKAATDARAEANKSLQVARGEIHEFLGRLGREIFNSGKIPAELSEDSARVNQIETEITALDLEISEKREEADHLKSGAKRFLIRVGVLVAAVVVIVVGIFMFFPSDSFEKFTKRMQVEQKALNDENKTNFEKEIGKSITLLDTNEDLAVNAFAEAIRGNGQGYKENMRLLADLTLKFRKEDQQKIAKLTRLAAEKVNQMYEKDEADSAQRATEREQREAMRKENTGQENTGGLTNAEVHVKENGDVNGSYNVNGISGTSRINQNGSAEGTFQGDGISGQSKVNNDGSGEVDYDIGGQKVKIKITKAHKDGSREGEYDVNGRKIKVKVNPDNSVQTE